MKDEFKYSVYKHTSPSGKVYIGITCQKPEDRWKNGSGYLNKNKIGNYGQPAMANAILKYGWDKFKHEILFENMSKKDAEKKEVELIAIYKSDNENFGYNIDRGGCAVGKKTKQTRQKMSNSKLGAKNAMYGKPSHRRIAVVCIETGTVYASMHDAECDTEVSRVCISRCCKKEQSTAGGLHWRYAANSDFTRAS